MYLSINEFKVRDFCGSNALWNYMVVNASLRSHIIHHDQSGFSCPNFKGNGMINNIYNNVANNVNDRI